MVGTKAIGIDTPEGMFEISKPLSRKADLAQIEAFLNRKGIKTKIIERGGRYILCREGEEARG
jgi:hypothetical protein